MGVGSATGYGKRIPYHHVLCDWIRHEHSQMMWLEQAYDKTIEISVFQSELALLQAGQEVYCHVQAHFFGVKIFPHTDTQIQSRNWCHHIHGHNFSTGSWTWYLQLVIVPLECIRLRLCLGWTRSHQLCPCHTEYCKLLQSSWPLFRSLATKLLVIGHP